MQLVHWGFTADHYPYVRWLSVHLLDIMTMSHLHPTSKQDSRKDTSQSRRRVMYFQTLEIDQSYDRHNAVVKDDGGAVCLTECPAGLQRWMFSGPVIARVIIDFERVDRPLCSSQECRRYSCNM